jgi:hypothetical protein
MTAQRVYRQTKKITGPRIGTIHSVAAEVQALGQAALPVQCDMRDEIAVEAT